ncbi:hypothetical protein NDGK_01748 [Clostridiales bacterium CHKCI001]|nr:hypothetical protein NDGK_01748 [Clostridiales bacterium CHKCI001]
MKYLLVETEIEKFWIEIGIDGYANRQIVIDELKKIHISCLEDCLAEGVIDENDLEGKTTWLTKKDFDSIWNLVISDYLLIWSQIKIRYPIGKHIKGICKYFYPQGAIIKGKDYIAVYKGKEKLQLNQYVQLKVVRYDDVNMWLIVG